MEFLLYTYKIVFFYQTKEEQILPLSLNIVGFFDQIILKSQI